MSFDPSSLFAAFIFGVIGFWLLKPAKEKGSFALGLIALALMIYPYFVEGAILNWGIGIALCALARFYW